MEIIRREVVSFHFRGERGVSTPCLNDPLLITRPRIVRIDSRSLQIDHGVFGKKEFKTGGSHPPLAWKQKRHSLRNAFS